MIYFNLLRFTVCAVVIAAVVNAFQFSRGGFLNKFSLDASVYETAEKAGNFKTLVKAIDAAGLKGVLSGPGPVTVFAPNDEAFSKLPAGEVDKLLTDLPNLRALLLFHTHMGKLEPTRNGRTFDSALPQQNGFAKQLTVKVASWTMCRYIVSGQPNVPQVIDTKTGKFAGEVYNGIACDNGLIHVINEVLIPYDSDQAPSVTAIGSRDIEGNAQLQKGFYGSQAGTGFGYLGNDQTINKESSGDAWKEGGNYGKDDFNFGGGKGGYSRNENGGDLGAYYNKQDARRGKSELEVTEAGGRKEMRPVKGTGPSAE